LQLQRDTLTALQQQQPAAARLLHAVGAGCPTTSDSCPVATQQQQQQLQRRLDASGDGACTCCWQQGCGSAEQGGSSLSSFCSCGAAGGPAPRRSPSATAGATVAIARRLSGWGYRVIVRKVLHSKAYWTKAMDNTFIVALDSSSGGHVEYVVDPHFKEAFNVGVMSDNYRCACVWALDGRVCVGRDGCVQTVQAAAAGLSPGSSSGQPQRCFRLPARHQGSRRALAAGAHADVAAPARASSSNSAVLHGAEQQPVCYAPGTAAAGCPRQGCTSDSSRPT
jgi:hypothetical protein